MCFLNDPNIYRWGRAGQSRTWRLWSYSQVQRTCEGAITRVQAHHEQSHGVARRYYRPGSNQETGYTCQYFFRFRVCGKGRRRRVALELGEKELREEKKR